jgi:hypothetical protein
VKGPGISSISCSSRCQLKGTCCNRHISKDEGRRIRGQGLRQHQGQQQGELQLFERSLNCIDRYLCLHDSAAMNRDCLQRLELVTHLYCLDKVQLSPTALQCFGRLVTRFQC